MQVTSLWTRALSLLCLCHTATLYATELTFESTPADHTVIIAAVGDILLHGPLQIKAARAGFESLWGVAMPYLRSADIAYANLEGPIASRVTATGRIVNREPNYFDDYVYTSYPLFNYHPKLANALKYSGFTIVSTANNHALDRTSIGIEKTLATLDAAGILHTGTSGETPGLFQERIITRNNVSVAWIACTEMSNVEDSKHQILHCFRKSDQAWLIERIKALKNEVDAIIITPHWGNEYQTYPTYSQRTFAHAVLDAGATAVIGAHPHVLQPMEKYITNDGRATLVMYSLGNFVSFQGSAKTKTTVILLLRLSKTGNKTTLSGVRYLPMQMNNRSGTANIRLEHAPYHSISAAVVNYILPTGNRCDPSQATNSRQCFSAF